MPLRSEHDIVLARQAVRRTAQDVGLSLVDQTKIVTAASELARNALIHGGGGQMLLSVLRGDTRVGVQISFIDQGPGIPNMELAMSDGWTSGGGLGMGLPGARRLVNEFDIKSAPGTGTQITVVRWK
ncbi:MAG: anti-sigma regulatory factor [Panacagrimonas sp.]|jgi:serine/threonine-protein kinase RsbT|nr:anti-sigma regulatory factor [Panacagrimonas sp.]